MRLNFSGWKVKTYRGTTKSGTKWKEKVKERVALINEDYEVLEMVVLEFKEKYIGEDDWVDAQQHIIGYHCLVLRDREKKKDIFGFQLNGTSYDFYDYRTITCLKSNLKFKEAMDLFIEAVEAFIFFHGGEMEMEPLHEMMDIIRRGGEEEKKCKVICSDIYKRWKDCVNLAEDRIWDIFSHLRPFVWRRVRIPTSEESRSYLFVSRGYIYISYRFPDTLLSHFIHAISNYSDEIISVIRPKIRDDFASLVPKAKKILEIKSRVSVPSVIRRGDFIIPNLDEMKIVRICAIEILGGNPCIISCTPASSKDRPMGIEIWRASRLFHLYPTIYEMLLELRDKVYAETEEIAKTFKEMEDIISPYILKKAVRSDG